MSETWIDHVLAVFITSDHGNIPCRGIGAIREGVLSDMKGERVRVYSNDVLRMGGRMKCPVAKIWKGGDLPDDFRPLIQDGRGAFKTAGEALVSHGGISIEECIVPFVRVRRKDGQ